MTSVTQLLEDQYFYRNNIVHRRRESAATPLFRQPKRPLDVRFVRYLDEKRLELYASQADTIDAFRAGHDVVIATSTGSGKTLGFNLCVGELLAVDRQATALYVYPTKALTHDQAERLAELDEATGLGAHPATYDGDTPAARKARAREESRILLTNFWGLHEYLPQVSSLQRYLSKLAVVVIDECHLQRGIMGTHVAFVVRRLQRLCNRLGASPRYLLASGTIANPGEHAAALIGREVYVIDGNGSGRGARTWLLWDTMADPDRSLTTQAAAVTAALAKAGYGTITFCGSRAGAEFVAHRASELSAGAPIGVYRAGLLPRERREVESKLRSGDLSAVVSTNALEVGIDIGSLDVAVVAGYPGTLSGLRQEVGRAGRAGQDSTALLMCDRDPLDQYWVRCPDALFGAPVERAVISLGNKEVLRGQALCAAAELPVKAEESGRFGVGLTAAVEALVEEGQLRQVRGAWVYVGSDRPASLVRIDSRRDDSIEVRVADELVEIMERHRALREAHSGAILFHGGSRLRVISLDLARAIATAEAIEAREHTRPIEVRSFALGTVEVERPLGNWRISLGPVQVWTQVIGYKIFVGDELVGMEGLDLPQSELSTRGLWLSPIDPETPAKTLEQRLLGSLHAAEHGLVHALSFLAMCDRGDAGGLSTVAHRFGNGCLVLLYDGHEGGSGIVEMAFDRFEELTALTLEMISGCDCELGCPRCVFDRLCGDDNQPMDRPGAVEVLSSLIPIPVT